MSTQARSARVIEALHEAQRKGDAKAIFVGPTPLGMSDEAWLKRNERVWQHFVDVTLEDSAVIIGWGTVAKSLLPLKATDARGKGGARRLG